MVSRYVSSVPMKPEGLCLLPAPPPPAAHHYRMLPPHRPDAYHATPPPNPYMQQQASVQPSNQGSSMRGGSGGAGGGGMPPTGPPNQSSTPPQSELKALQTQQGPMQVAYMPQQMRTGQATNAYYQRPGPPPQPGQTSGGPRIPNHQRHTVATSAAVAAAGSMQQMYPPVPIFSGPPAQAYQVPLPYNNPTRPPVYFPQTYPATMLPGAQFFNNTYTGQQPAQHLFYPGGPMPMQGRPGPNAAGVASGTQPGAPNAGAPAAVPPMQQPMPQVQKKRARSNAIPIIDPFTGKQLTCDEESQPPSGESSVRETPQPAAAAAASMLISADFAARVAIVANEGKEATPVVEMIVEQQSVPMPPYTQPPPAAVIMSTATVGHRNGDTHRLADTVVQNSKLQANIKEFVPEMTRHGSATPVVSANTDGVEVTLPTKQSRERDSPAKARKQHSQQQQQQVLHPQLSLQQHRESMPVKETGVEISEASAPIASHQQPVHEPNEMRTNKVVISAPVPTSIKTKMYTDNKGPTATTPAPENKSAGAQPALDEPVALTASVTVGKSRVAAQRNRDPVANTTMQQQPPTRQSMPVPSSQPAKPSSKANRARDLNTKGANKEGTDMDAFDTSDATIRPDNNNSSTANDHVLQAPLTTVAAPAPPTIAAAPAPPTLAAAPAPVAVTTPDSPTSTNTSSSQHQNQQQYEHPTDQQHQHVPIPAQIVPKVEQPTAVAPTLPPAATVPTPVQPQKLTDMKTMPKPRVDVTSIVKDEPRPMRPVQQPPPATSPLDTQDETERVAAEKLVQAKNEANTIRTNADNNETQSNDKTTVRYKKDQWSPINTEGKKCYDRDFLICLQNTPKSKKKPDNLPDLEVVLKENAGGGGRSRMLDGRPFGGMNRQPESLMPMFHKSLSQRGPLPKRNSQQGKAGGGGGGGGKAGGNKPNPIHVTLSLREDVKLRETENAWRPARLNASTTVTEYEAKSYELYKRVRGVLNKLTPEKFDKLVNQVRALSIDNADRLQGVIDLVFEKAVDEPNFSVAYALMCKELALMQVPSGTKKDDQMEYVNFRKLLINRCQLEFEKNSVDESLRNAKIKEIEACTDQEKKKELQLGLEEDVRRVRIKSVGNIRFIGELFKQQMLTVKIMMRCINILLENNDEDSLECLCKLLTTIGKDLEVHKNQNLQQFFNIMEDIVEKKPSKISSRVRFMLQDVVDLRNSKWIPRRQDLNPKTMEQIQKEADTEQLNIQVMNSSVMSTPRKDDRGGGGGGGGNVGGSERDRDRKRRNQTDDGWSMATSSRNRTPYQFESAKLLNVKPPAPEEMTLGSKQMFGTWGRGSNIKPQQHHAPVTNTTNMYAALENIGTTDADKNRGAALDLRLTKDPYVSKGHSMERGGYKQHGYDDGRGSRSGSQQRQQQQRSMPPTATTPLRQQPTQQQQMVQQQQQPVTPVQQQQQPAPPQLTPEQFKLRMQNTLDELLNDCCSLAECEADIRTSIEPSRLHEFVVCAYMNNLERSSSARRKVGKLAAHLVHCGLVSVEVCCRAVAEVLSQADDLLIDIPKIWEYLAELLVPLVADDSTVTLGRLLDTCVVELRAQEHAHKLLAQLLALLVADSGPGLIAERWRQSGARLTDFVAADKLESYVKEHNLDFLMGGAGAPVGSQSQFTWEQVSAKLLQFFRANTQFDTITDWISANVGERVSDKPFIRTLVTTIVENAVVTSNKTLKLRSDVLKNHYTLLQRYVDNKEPLELQCLFALQALVHKWEHPPGLLLAIFERVWEDGVLSNDSFLAWENCHDPAEQEGKGVALKSLQSLFTALKEVDDESGSSISEDA